MLHICLIAYMAKEASYIYAFICIHVHIHHFLIILCFLLMFAFLIVTHGYIVSFLCCASIFLVSCTPAHALFITCFIPCYWFHWNTRQSWKIFNIQTVQALYLSSLQECLIAAGEVINSINIARHISANFPFSQIKKSTIKKPPYCINVNLKFYPINTTITKYLLRMNSNFT